MDSGDSSAIVTVHDTYDVNRNGNLAEPTPDLDLAARVTCAAVDMGAYEQECEACICPADFTGVAGPGFPDLNVDSLDFLLLIAQWGSPCTQGGCEADITGTTPLLPDGNVGSLDFLLMIAQWGNPGNCPGPPMGSDPMGSDPMGSDPKAAPDWARHVREALARVT